MMNEQRTSAGLALETMVDTCYQGHAWQPTIILGYFQCSRCSALAACHSCVSNLRGQPLVGVCQQHQHLGTPETRQEVLA